MTKVYGDFKFKVLAKGKEEDIYWFIISLGSHPCSYIALPKGHELYGKSYEDVEIYPHGGFTYAESEYSGNVIELGDYWFLGWDYAHLGDYFLSSVVDRDYEHKWTLEELKEEMDEILDQVKDI